MDVQLYVYDLTQGMARSMSRQFLGIQIDAVYHTALVFGNIEYFFGAGVQTCYPGATHHGRPMEIIPMGSTQLPLEVILEYLESLKEVYTPESYDLFAHNCNNFTNDFSMFLVGKGIPHHITSLPRRVLETPFGQMLRPSLEAGMRSVTQAPVPSQNVPAATSRPQPHTNGRSRADTHPLLGSTSPTLYTKLPPLPKLRAKLDPIPAESDTLLKFLEHRSASGARDTPLPDLKAIGLAYRSKVVDLPLETRFAAVDLLRCAMTDARVSGYLAEEQDESTVAAVLKQTLELDEKCPHNLRLVSVHLASNLFGSHLYVSELMKEGSELKSLIVELIGSCLLDVDHSTTRVAAACLAFNLAVAVWKTRKDDALVVDEGQLVELLASLLETLQRGIGSEEGEKALVLSAGYLLDGAEKEGELKDLCAALDAKTTLHALKGHEKLVKAVISML
nr:hypothetical protein B0A51_11884 [Rachicladosporium sp. CCFEE 5018]